MHCKQRCMTKISLMSHAQLENILFYWSTLLTTHSKSRVTTATETKINLVSMSVWMQRAAPSIRHHKHAYHHMQMHSNTLYCDAMGFLCYCNSSYFYYYDLFVFVYLSLWHVLKCFECIAMSNSLVLLARREWMSVNITLACGFWSIQCRHIKKRVSERETDTDFR